MRHGDTTCTFVVRTLTEDVGSAECSVNHNQPVSRPANMGKDRERNHKPRERDLRQFFLGIIAAFGYNSSYIGGIACIQLMKETPPDFELGTLRFTIGLIFASIFLISKRKTPTIERKNIKWLLVIIVVTVTCNLALYTHNLKHLTFVGILSLLSGFALVFILILSRIFLKSRIPLFKGVIVLFAVLGVCLVLVSQYTAMDDCNVNQSITATLENIYNTSTDSFNTITVTYGPDYADKINTFATTNSPENFPSKNNFVARRSLSLNENTSNAVTNIPENFTAETTSEKPCVKTTVVVTAVLILILARFCGCAESVIVAGTGLRDENPVVISIWYFIAGTVFSAIMMVTLENPFIPKNTTDVLLCFGYSICASSVTYFDLLAVQNIDVNVYYITGTAKLPVAFLLQMTLLKSVTPKSTLWMLVCGMGIVFVCALVMPFYEYFRVKNSAREEEEKSAKEMTPLNKKH